MNIICRSPIVITNLVPRLYEFGFYDVGESLDSLEICAYGGTGNYHDVIDFLDAYRLDYPKLRYMLTYVTPDGSNLRIHINKRGKKIVTENAKKLMSL